MIVLTLIKNSLKLQKGKQYKCNGILKKKEKKNHFLEIICQRRIEEEEVFCRFVFYDSSLVKY